MELKNIFKKTGKGLEGIVTKAIGLVVKPVKGTYNWVSYHRQDITDGFFIGADTFNFVSYWDPVGTVKSVITGEEAEEEEPDSYSIGVERAKKYASVHENTPYKKQGGVARATLLGYLAGFASLPVTYPLWIHWKNKRKTKELYPDKDQNVSPV